MSTNSITSKIGAVKPNTALFPITTGVVSLIKRLFGNTYVPKPGDFAGRFTPPIPPTTPQPKTTPLPTGNVAYHSASEMKFNLPPHDWSLPISPTNVTGRVDANYTDHSTRRAIMWYYDAATPAKTDTGIIVPTNTGVDTNNKGAASHPQDNYWGFQFLWNPTDFTNILTRNANVVPSSLDAHAALSGLFTAMENIQFTIVIDRINDFVCIKGKTYTSDYATTPFIDYKTIADKYYTSGYPGTSQDKIAQLSDLAKKGTMADIEYIYKMINGSGQNGKLWENGLNRITSDLAFLSPTAVALQLGPTADSLSYIGWFESLTIKHSVFTEDMIPIHSEVTASFNAFSRVALTN